MNLPVLLQDLAVSTGLVHIELGNDVDRSRWWFTKDVVFGSARRLSALVAVGLVHMLTGGLNGIFATCALPTVTGDACMFPIIYMLILVYLFSLYRLQ